MPSRAVSTLCVASVTEGVRTTPSIIQTSRSFFRRMTRSSLTNTLEKVFSLARPSSQRMRQVSEPPLHFQARRVCPVSYECQRFAQPNNPCPNSTKLRSPSSKRWASRQSGVKRRYSRRATAIRRPRWSGSLPTWRTQACFVFCAFLSSRLICFTRYRHSYRPDFKWWRWRRRWQQQQQWS